MNNYILVFLGGGIGASLRYWMSGIIPRYTGSHFPYGILFVNVLGCFLIGFIMSVLEERFVVNPSLRVFLAIGILGGFTTFSSFSYETIAMLRDNEVLKASLYISSSLLLCLAGTQIGSWIGKLI